MTVQIDIEKSFREKVCEEVNLISHGVNRYLVETPYIFGDGDAFVIVLKKQGNKWILTDEGHTFMHLSYFLDIDDISEGTRGKIVESTLSAFQVEERGGQLITEIEGNDFGNSLYDFVQAVMKISDVTFLSRERVKSTFFEDFKKFISETIPKENLEFFWHHQELDKEEKYVVDCKVESNGSPIFVFALTNDDKVRDANIIIQQYRRWNQKFTSLAIFEKQEDINRRVLARFTDVCDRQFSSLEGNKNNIKSFLIPNR